MATLETNYQALIADDNEGAAESVVFHVASEGRQTRWNHVGDLDLFFRQIYYFHQQHGFYCILINYARSLIITVCIWLSLIYAPNCIYFNFDEPPSPIRNMSNPHFGDLFIPPSQCIATFGFWTWCIVAGGVVVLTYQLYKVMGSIYSYKEIEQFYESAMKISKGDINNITWHEVQCKLRDVQHEQQMCVHKSDLTELDIYHRILRIKNYMVALTNKNILPVKLNMKCIGEWIYLSSFLEANIEFILFRSGSSPFKTSGILREDYRKYSKRKELADELSRCILWLGIGNALLMPFVLIYQFLNFFITYSGSMRYEPAMLAVRKWSLYGKLYLRHFNELDHELHSRLSRAYKPSNEYMKSFSSPLIAGIAKLLQQLVSAIIVILAGWGILKEKIFMIDNVLLILTTGTLLYYALSALIPDENIVYFPSQLMQHIVADIHYVPDHFKAKAHTSNVRAEFSQFFPSTLVYLIEELLSPIITPYALIFHLRHKSLEIVDFFRNFSVNVTGVGDVCSFALMDVSKHGNQQWTGPSNTRADQYQQAEGGKTELSLIHFTLMNPQWEPPPSSNMFMTDFREQVVSARGRLPGVQENPLYASLNSLSTLGSRYASLVHSVHHSAAQPQMAASGMVAAAQPQMEMSEVVPAVHPQMALSSLFPTAGSAGARRAVMSGALIHAEGPPFHNQAGILSSLTDENAQRDLNPMEVTAADMSLSALFLHEVHDKHVESTRQQSSSRHCRDPDLPRNEESLLLDMRKSNYP